MFTALELVNELLSRFGLKEVTALGQTSDAILALRKLNIAQQIVSTKHPFVWAEKNTPGTLTAVAGTNIYSLASDVAHLIVAKHTYEGGGDIKVIDRATLEKYRADRTQTADRGTPRFICIAGVLQATAADTPLLRAELWPVPDANFAGQSISYYYTFKLAALTGATDISLIPGDFHWLLLEIAESLYRRGPIRVGGDGAQSQIDLFTIAENKAAQGMKDIISRDSALSTSEMSWEPEDPNI
jgi:hypothetical protein